MWMDNRIACVPSYARTLKPRDQMDWFTSKYIVTVTIFHVLFGHLLKHRDTDLKAGWIGCEELPDGDQTSDWTFTSKINCCISPNRPRWSPRPERILVSLDYYSSTAKPHLQCTHHWISLTHQTATTESHLPIKQPPLNLTYPLNNITKHHC